MEQSDQALELLKPYTDFFCVVDNEENFSEPRLRLCEMRDSKQGQQMLWTIRLETDEVRFTIRYIYYYKEILCCYPLIDFKSVFL